MASSTQTAWKEGDKTKGACETCKAVVSATFRLAPLEFGGDIIPDVLQSFCDTCGGPVGIPHQSSSTIKAFLNNKKNTMGIRNFTNKEYEVLAGILSQFYGSSYDYRDAVSWVDENKVHMSKSALTKLDRLRLNIITAPLEEMPLLLNSDLKTAQIIAKWRLMIGR